MVMEEEEGKLEQATAAAAADLLDCS